MGLQGHRVNAGGFDAMTVKEPPGRLCRTMDSIVGELERLPMIHKRDLLAGDQLIVTTANSVYSLRFTESRTFAVNGGWFDREAASPVLIGINGCTWGGSIIMTGVVVGIGLCIEFANGVVTSPVCDARLLRCKRTRTPECSCEAADRRFLESVGMSWRNNES